MKAEGPVAGVLDGRRCNRGVRLGEIMYEPLTWQGFEDWIEENHKESKTAVDSFFSEIGEVEIDIEIELLQ